MIKTIGYSILVVLCVISTELTCRLYWEYKIPGAFFDPDRIIYNYQRNLLETGLPDADVRGDDGYFDVLLLGGSVVSHGFARIDDYLAEGLSGAKGPVRVWNGAEAAHTSRDSWEKYSLVADKHFDLVIVYNGINESRFNNAEPGRFRPDYSHVGWYRQINAFHEHREIGYFVLPFVLHKMLIDAESRFGWLATRMERTCPTPATGRRSPGTPSRTTSSPSSIRRGHAANLSPWSRLPSTHRSARTSG